MGESNERLLGHTVNVATMTLVSRILGYVRDRILASLLGTSYLADAFYIAFRIPNTFRRFVAEGAMTAALVPVLSYSFQEDGPERAWLFARRFLYVFGLFLIILGIAGSLAAPLIVRAMAWDYAVRAPEIFELTKQLTAILFPYITLVSLAAVAMGILNCRGVFAFPALTPAFLNLSIIIAAVFWGYGSKNPTHVLAVGVLIGGGLQFVLQLPLLKKRGMSLRPAFSIKDKHIRQVFRLMGPGVLGAGAGQLLILVGTALASTLGEGAVSALYYANRITELAFGLFAVSISTVILPSLSRQASGGEKKELAATLERGLSAVFFFITPAALGILALSKPIIEVLFHTGRFSEASVTLTTGPLLAYAIGMVPWAVDIVLTKGCHAHKDMMTPLWAGVASLIAFILMALYFMPMIGVAGIALASSIAALINGAVLLYGLSKKHAIDIPWLKLSFPFIKILLLSCTTGAAAWWVNGRMAHGSLLLNVTALFSAVLCGMAVFGAGAWFLRFPEARQLMERISSLRSGR